MPEYIKNWDETNPAVMTSPDDQQRSPQFHIVLTHSWSETSKEASESCFFTESDQSADHGTFWPVSLVDLGQQCIGGLKRVRFSPRCG